MDERPTRKRLVCYECGDEVDCCEFCDGEMCPKAICRGCVIVAIGQEIPQVHPHGG